ncbi:MAG: DUF3157 family protein [Algibacter sp.]
MKKCLLVLVLLISFIGFSQDNHIVKTEDGRRVLLKADFTWEYIDINSPVIDTATKKDSCNIEEGFEEPKLDSKIQSQLKRGHATIDHVKKKVAKDYKCDVTDVLLLKFSEQKAKAVYHFCANGKKATYKRIGNSIIKAPTFL